MTATFGFPETNGMRALSAVSKARKLPDGRFEAVAALFFECRRINQRHVIASSRAKAERAAMRWIETGRAPTLAKPTPSPGEVGR